MIRILDSANPVRVNFLDDSPRIRDRHSPRGRRRRRHILLIKRRSPRTALSVQRIRRHLVGELTLVQNVRHKGIVRLLRLLLRILSRLQQFHQNRRHDRLVIVRQLRPTDYSLAHFRLDRLRTRSRWISEPLECVEFHLYICVVR